MINDGIKNELDIIDYINEKSYINKMNDNIRDFLQFIFDFDISNCKITACKYIPHYKPDIKISANGVTKYISIKCGATITAYITSTYILF